MLIIFSCPECKVELEVDARMVGSQTPCPQCGKSLVIPRREPGRGVTIGQFQIQKFLSKGGMGEVFLARQLSMGRNVALKILPAHLRGQKMRVQRFLKEIQTLARLDHPNIVMAHEAGEDEGVLYLAMSYVPGDSLEKRLQDTGPMAELDALKLIDKLAGALDYAWREHHLLHRDIKPANILITAGGEVKLTDFGLAKCLDDATELTMSGDIIGSPNYMSPEQVNNCMDLDCRSDMYSMGATLYHMLTGKLPFAGSSLMETLKKQINESLPDPRLERSEISEACIILLEIMLAKDRNDRHPDYPALRADIARAIAGERPTKTSLKPGESVLLRLIADRIPHRTKTPPVLFKPLFKKKIGMSFKRAVGVTMALVIVVLVVVLARGSWRKAKQASSAANIPRAAAVTSAPALPATASVTPPADDANARLREKFLQALKYAREHPEDFAGTQALLESLREDGKGTEWEGKIAYEIERMERLQRWAINKDVRSLWSDVKALLVQSNFDGALKRIETDSRIVTGETKLACDNLMLEVKARKQAAEEANARETAEAERAKQAEAGAKLAALTQGLANDLLKGNMASLSQRISEAGADPALGIVSNRTGALINLALQVTCWSEQVVKSFEKSRGKLVKVELKGGRTESFTLTGVAGDRIQGQLQLSKGYVGRDFSVNELSTAEKLKRIEDVPPPAGKLMRGLIMVRCANDWNSAGKEFAQGGPLGEALLQLSPVLTNSMARKPMGAREGPARYALQNLLKLAGVSGELSSAQALAAAIRHKEYSPDTVAKIKIALENFNKNYAQTETAKEYAPVIIALGKVGNYAPPAQRPFRRR